MLEKILKRAKKAPVHVWRQGDVFVIPLASLPDGLASVRPVLAEGEVTGHSHRIADPSTAQAFSNGSELFLQVTADHATVVHDEHRPISLPRGPYAIRIQREYHPKEIRRVVD